MLDPTTGRPAAAPDAPNRVADAPERVVIVDEDVPGTMVPKLFVENERGDEAEDRRHQTSAIFAQGARSSTASG